MKGRRKCLQPVWQASLSVAVFAEMLLPGADNALAHALGDVGVVFEVPPLVNRHRERQPALEIAVVQEVLLCRRHGAAGGRYPHAP